MMARILCISFFAATIMLQGCSEDNENHLITEDAYSGIFYRMYPQARILTSEVTLNLDNGKFSGSSSMDNYPAICNGTFEIQRNTIEFTNGCAFTADFDWSFILDGTYEIDEQDNYTYFIQEVEPEVYNIFRFPK